MRIALYTIFRCTNYGAVLQALALSKKLRMIAGDDAVEVINHRMDPRDTHLLGKITNPNTPWFQRWRNRRKFAQRYYRPNLFEERRARTIDLISGMIRPTDTLYKTPAELERLPRYDSVIVGSDQVWHPTLNYDFGFNPYLGGTLPRQIRRVAYAASFGVSELPSEFEVSYREALSAFDVITVREASGAAICEKLLGRTPEVVLDPTLLLDPNEWMKIADVDQVQTDGLVAYWVRTPTQADIDRLAKIARERGTHIRLLSAGPLPKLAFPSEVRPDIAADPLDFVTAVAGSNGVITESFHGLQFAFLFGKPFIALGDLHKAGSNASRLVDFCKRYCPSEAVGDIEEFRSGCAVRRADPANFDRQTFESDRSRSLAALKGMIG